MSYDKTERQVTGYGFVVDTESYAGNFERETVAHMTGRYGECDVGKEAAQQALREFKATPEGKRFRRWCERHVASKPDDNGCYRPATIYPTPGWLNDGMGGVYREAEAGSPEVVARYVEAVRAYHEPLAKQAEESAQRADAEGDSKDAAAWRRDAAGHRETIATAERRGPGRFPSYQSVVVWLDRFPPPWVIAVMKQRAAAFMGRERKYDGPHVVTGYRVVKVVEVTQWRSV